MSRDCSCNDGGQLLAQVLDLCLQFRCVQRVTANLRVGGGELADQNTDLPARVCECVVSNAGGHVPLLLPKFDGVNPKACLAP
jgi:hypothetical protein